MKVWKTGERMVLRVGTKTVIGYVRLASPNGVSLFLEFEGMLAGHLGGMPVIWVPEDGRFETLLGGSPVYLSELPAAEASEPPGCYTDRRDVS